MLPLKLVRSLVLGEPLTHPSLFHTHHSRHPCENDSDDDGGGSDDYISGNATDDNKHQPRRTHRPARTKRRGKKGGRPLTPPNARAKTPLLLFTPTSELIQDTYRLASLARDIGMDLYPNSSLSHLIFSWPTPLPHGNFPSSSSSASASTSTPSSYRPSFSSSATSTSSSTPLTLSLCSLPNDAVPLPFPSLTLASISLLRYFVSLSKGLFKLVFLNCDFPPGKVEIDDRFSTWDWDCSSFRLLSKATGFQVETMEGFSRVLAGHGWTLFKTGGKDGVSGPGDPEFYGTSSVVYLFRKVDSNRVRARERSIAGGENCRVRELRLPPLDFKNVPMRILQYIILMTDDVFNLA